jgi:K+-transporting ATPase ATPase B chain
MGLDSQHANDGRAAEAVRLGRRMSVLSSKVLADSLVRLSPVRLLSNPVMLIVELTFFIVAAMAASPQSFVPVASVGERIYYAEIAVILLITVWFSTLSDALAEQQAKNTARSLRKLESEVPSKKVVTEGWTRTVLQTSSKDLRKGDLILLEKGDVVPLDSEVLEGLAMVDESLLTGESAPVKKAPGDALIGGSRVVSDTLTSRVTANPGETFVDQMIRMVESSKRPKTPNEQAVTVVLIGLTAIFTIIVGSLLGLSITLNLGADLSVLIALYVCLLPTTIGALLPAIGLSGISRLYARKIVAKSGKAIETAGDADVILLDKTGTITVGNRRAIEFVPLAGHTEREVGEAAFLSSWHDDTPEGRSIINLAYEKGFVPRELNSLALSEVEEFSASTRTSGVRITRGMGFVPSKGNKSGEGRMRFSRKFASGSEENGFGELDITKGAPDSAKELLAVVPEDFEPIVNRVSSAGETAMALVRNGEAIGIIRLKDVMKEGIKEKIQAVKTLGIRPVMITGDQPLTAKSIASEVGIDEFVPRARPEDKFEIVRKEQAQGRIVAMIGDGTNDAPALAVADVGLAMNSGTEAAKEAANMVDLESNPAKIIDVVMLGKQLLMTRGAVTAFSIANDVAKYFAIMPVLFATTIPQLQAMNILGLGLNTAVLSALIFNAIIIPLLIPLAMKGVAFKAADTMTIFLRNVLIYGIGGVVVPFVGIKLIDILISVL